MTKDKVLQAAGFILIYATIIGFTDNYVRVIAAEAGLWQFHFTRTVMAIAILAAVAIPLKLRLKPVNLPAVVARSAIHGLSMVIYFGALAFLPVALVAAGLFTAPIFVLLISRFAYAEVIGPFRIIAVILGFCGAVLVLGPEAFAGASLPALLPVIAGALYALGNIATRKWCPQESAETLLAGFFLALGVIGLLGMAALTMWPIPVPDGVAGFLQRGPVWPSPTAWFWIFVQAAGSLLGVGLMVRAYQIADATRVSVFEYAILPSAAIWAWILWGEVLTPVAIVGMLLIVAAGLMITIRATQTGRAQQIG
ncbi:MAG: DMT family transporter [Paracoccaceae bacterium]